MTAAEHPKTRIPQPGRGVLIAILTAAFAVGAVILVMTVRGGSAAPELDNQETTFLQLLNDYRADHGKPPLAAHPQLNAAADWYATDMATQNYFGDYVYCMNNFQIPSAHCDSLGRLPGARVRAFGYPSGVGENTAGGFMSAQSVFDAWAASAGHNANMLGNYRVIGIGWACNQASRYRCYWVTDFGNEPPPVTPVPTPSAPPTETPSPTATPVLTPQLQWGDLDCNGSLDSGDALSVLLDQAGLTSYSSSAECPPVGSYVSIDGESLLWGDIDCSDEVATADSIELLKRIADVGASNAPAGCPQL